MKRERRLIKQRKSLIKQAEKHKEKIETEKGRKDTTHDYWFKEVEGFEKQAEKRSEILKRLKEKSKKGKIEERKKK